MDDRSFTEKDAEEWISMIEATGPKQRDNDVYPLLNQWISQSDPKLILEVGAGQGVCSDKIDLTDRTYIGVEPSPHLLDRAKHLYGSPNRRFIPGNAYAVPLPSASVDAAFSVMVWHLLGDIKKASIELGRVLKSGGKFLIMTTHPDYYEKLRSGYRDVRVEGIRFEGTMISPPNCRDVLYLHSLEEMTSGLSLGDLVITKAVGFRENTLLAIEGRKK